MNVSKSTIAKCLGWIGAFAFYAQHAIQAQTVLPHDVKGWLSLIGSLAIGFAVHHASNTDGTK